MARLARLALSDEEIEPMARELSAVLDHVARIGELDLGDVPPTSLPREVAFDQAPAVGDEGFLVPSPQA